jgi:hypothetical protein
VRKLSALLARLMKLLALLFTMGGCCTQPYWPQPMHMTDTGRADSCRRKLGRATTVAGPEDGGEGSSWVCVTAVATAMPVCPLFSRLIERVGRSAAPDWEMDMVPGWCAPAMKDGCCGMEAVGCG